MAAGGALINPAVIRAQAAHSALAAKYEVD
jgi:hypothetical protein